MGLVSLEWLANHRSGEIAQSANPSHSTHTDV